MSYCRWSDDDYSCDVYTYEDASFGGWTTSVASSRIDFVEALPPVVSLPQWRGEKPDEAAINEIRAYFDRHKKVSEIINRSKIVPIGLSFDGAMFNDPTPGACADRLMMLREAGYSVPQYAIARLRAEEALAEDNA